MYVYVLHSESDGMLYTGCTKELRNRLNLHNAGQVSSTKERRPLTLVYYEYCIDKRDAFKREKYLKTTYGKRYLKNRMANYFVE
jgi:putative endonuclease